MVYNNGLDDVELFSQWILVGATITLYDGNPVYPSMNTLWELAEKAGITYFGTSAGFITSCMKHGMKPGESYNFEKLRAIGSTGSPLTNDGFTWVYENVKKDLKLVSLWWYGCLYRICWRFPTFTNTCRRNPMHTTWGEGRSLG